MPGDVTRWTDSAARRVAAAVRTTEAAPWVKGGQTINRGRNGSVTPVHTRLGRIDSESSGGQYSVTFMRAASASSLEAVPSIDAVTAYEVNGTEALIADGTVTVVLIGVLDQDGAVVWLFKGPGITPKRSIEFDTDDEIDGQLQLVNDMDSATLAARAEMSVYAYDESIGDWTWQQSVKVENIIGIEKNDTLATVVGTFQEQWVLKVGSTRTASLFTDSGAALDPTTDPVDPDDATISANLVMWLDANALTGLTDGDSLTTWTDESGNGNAPAGSGSTRPLYKTSIRNGNPAVYFDGTDDYLFKSTNVIPYTGNWTIFIVCKNGSFCAPISSNDGTSDTSSSDTSWRLDSGSGNYRSVVGWLGGSTIGTDDSGWHIFTMDNTASTTVRSWMDGAAGGSNAFAWQNDDVMLGRYHNGAAFEYHEGYIAEVIAYNAKLTDAQRNGVNAYLSAKYGIAVAG
jgi:hypothetical protein